MHLKDSTFDGQRRLLQIPGGENLMLVNGLISGVVVYDQNLSSVREIILDLNSQDSRLIHGYFRNSCEAFLPISDRF